MILVQLVLLLLNCNNYVIIIENEKATSDVDYLLPVLGLVMCVMCS